VTAWAIFALIVAALIAADLCVKGDLGFRAALIRTLGYVAIACAFGAWVWSTRGHDDGVKFFTGYVLEASLSLDNVFIISLIFGALAVPRELRHRVLVIGVLSAIVLRAIFIGAGAALVGRFEWALLICGGFLVYTGFKVLASNDEAEVDLESNRALKLLRRIMPVTSYFDGQRFFTRLALDRRLFATPLFVALVLVEIADLAVTTDPFLVYTSNIFAILGLRSLYGVLEAMVGKFEYVGKAVAVVLIFVGVKVVLGHAEALPTLHIPNTVSLGVVLALLATGVLASIWKARRAPA
jgi:tellurite resistance protein TerC